MTEWGGKRHSVSYDKNIFGVVSKTEDELQLNILDVKDSPTINIVTIPNFRLSEGVLASDLLDQAKVEFEDSFEKVTNEIADRSSSGGAEEIRITITGYQRGSEELSIGMTRVLISENSIFQIKIIDLAKKVEKYIAQIQELFDSAEVSPENE
ncbi:MAG: hypothetical protein GX421_06585 [Caldisericales bacterium]|nr:hypothetical protein [Caldisericales bacterium]